MFREQWFAILGTLVCVGSSSYLIWASNAKDHMLQIFLLSVIIFGIISYLYSRKFKYWFISFFFIGLLAWDRPEMGIPILISVFLIFFLFTMNNFEKNEKGKNLLFLILSPFFTLIGAIPLFINNYIVSGNPLIVMYTVWNSDIGGLGAEYSNPILISGGMTEGLTSGASHGILSIVSLTIRQITPHFNSLGQDLFGIFFLTKSGSIGLLLLTPLFITGLLIIPIWYHKFIKKPQNNEIYAIISFAIVAFGILISFTRSFPGLYQSGGIGPDMRYLCPIYLPLNLIGLILVSPFLLGRGDLFKIIKYTFTFFLGLLVVFVLALFSYFSKDVDYFFLLTKLTTGVTILTLIAISLSTILLYSHWRWKIDIKYFLIALSLIIAIPIIWQLGTVFLISTKVAAAEGYPFWLPFVRKIVYGLFGILKSGLNIRFF